MRAFTRYDEVGSTEFTNEVLSLLALWHLSSCARREAREVEALIRRQDWHGLCHYELDPLQAWDTRDYINVRQALAFFQKRDDLDIGVDPQSAAWEKFVEAEALCAQTNQIFESYSRGRFYFVPRVESVLYVAQRKISRILGDLPSLGDLKLRFGPGATTQVKKRDASVRRKLAQAFCSSEDMIGLLPEVLSEVPLWSQVPLDETRSVTHSVRVTAGKVSFVRKTAKTDRTIAVEPMMNGFVQLGVGDYIAARLRTSGIDLRDQTLNQRLAQEGSITGALATLDLSSASDTVAKGLVQSLLPFEWWDFLRQLRTAVEETPNGDIRLEKFSSMGNGFTFALESLIFYALAKASEEVSGHRGPVSVYGDDIIVPTGAVPLLIEVLTACGFLVNKSKSYFSGNFRESCGKDYLSGTNVRPFYQKGPLAASDVFTLHNFYVRNMLPEPAAMLLEILDGSLRIFGPDGFGDGHLLGDFDPRPINRDDGWSGYTFDTFTYLPRRAFYRLGADYVYPAYSTYLSGDAEFQPVTNPELRDKRGRTLEVLSKRPAWWHRWSGSGQLRPDHQPSVYRTNPRGVQTMEDILPGVKGYNRITVYYLG